MPLLTAGQIEAFWRTGFLDELGRRDWLARRTGRPEWQEKPAGDDHRRD